MGEEGTEHRLTTLEKTSDKTEKVLDAHTVKLNEIEKISIEQNVSLKIIIWISKALLTVFIGLFVTNIWMFLVKK